VAWRRLAVWVSEGGLGLESIGGRWKRKKSGWLHRSLAPWASQQQQNDDSIGLTIVTLRLNCFVNSLLQSIQLQGKKGNPKKCVLI
jgi:hypothetical protein